MANTLYDTSRQMFLEGGINWLGDTIKVALIDKNAYSPNFSTNLTLADVPPTAFVAPVSGSQAGTTLTGKTTAGGAAYAANVTFSSVAAGLPESEALLIYKDTSVIGTSPLIALIDSATGLPITPNGGDIIVVWDTGVNKIFRL